MKDDAIGKNDQTTLTNAQRRLEHLAREHGFRLERFQKTIMHIQLNLSFLSLVDRRVS